METLFVIIVSLFAVFVRLFRIDNFATLTAEVGQHYLEIIKLFQGKILLDGPLTSHNWLRLSSTPYYFFAPVFAVLNFHPLTLFYLSIASEILTISLNYYVVKKILGRKTAIISTLFLAVSPLVLNFGRTPGFYSFVIPFVYVLMLQIHGAIKDKNHPIWPVFLTVGFMSTLHSAALMLLPFLLIVFYKLSKLTAGKLAKSLIAFAIPNLPFLITDSIHSFSMTRSLVLWIPYKFYNFLTGKTLGLGRANVPDNTLTMIAGFLKTSILPDYFHWIFGAIIFLAIAGYFILRKTSLTEKILCCWLVFGLTVLLIHKNPPLHYFVPFFTLTIILFSKVIAESMGRKDRPLIPTATIILIILVNLMYIFSNGYLFRNPSLSPEFVPYKDQAAVAEVIINSARGKPFSLSRVGPFSQYEGQFAQNYVFLLWRLGNTPVKKSDNRYLIEDGDSDREKVRDMLIIGRKGKVSVFRNQ